DFGPIHRGDMSIRSDSGWRSDLAPSDDLAIPDDLSVWPDLSSCRLFAPPLRAHQTQLQSTFAIADFNGDRKPDLVVNRPQPDRVRVLLGKGDGTFAAGGDYATGPFPYAFPGDWNGDGKVDLAVVESGELRILLGIGNGTFGAPARYPLPFKVGRPQS